MKFVNMKKYFVFLFIAMSASTFGQKVNYPISIDEKVYSSTIFERTTDSITLKIVG